MTRRRKRGLSSDEEALWDAVARTVKPLHGRPLPSAERPARLVFRGQEAAEPQAPPAFSPRPAAGIERKHHRRLAKGRQTIESRLDLHGMTQDQAFRALRRHLSAAYVRGERTILVITGKGGARLPQTGTLPAEFRRRTDFAIGSGVLKRMVPLWLETPELAPLVRAFAPAHERHGGEGALYVLLRRALPED